MSRYRFHCTIHARPPVVEQSAPIVLGERPCRPLRVTSDQLGQPLAVSFEEAAIALQRLPRMFLEPDGSFVWVSSDGSQPWQVDGCLYDRAGRLMYVELKGECTAEGLRELTAAVGAARQPVCFQLVRQAVFLDEDEFLRYCALLA